MQNSKSQYHNYNAQYTHAFALRYGTNFECTLRTQPLLFFYSDAPMRDVVATHRLSRGEQTPNITMAHQEEGEDK